MQSMLSSKGQQSALRNVCSVSRHGERTQCSRNKTGSTIKANTYVKSSLNWSELVPAHNVVLFMHVAMTLMWSYSCMWL